MRQEGRMGLSMQWMMRLALFPKSTLVGDVHRLERGRRLRLTQKRDPNWAVAFAAPQPPTLKDSLQVGVCEGPVRHWMNWHSNRGGASPPPGVKQAEVEAVRPCHRHLWGVEMGVSID
ncbi:hypothetical protein BY996DRAFT_6449408 [Phakopsora pachyrhizi]|nr:hypothetical protein BY996DRAFT_6449408 [Phakopsora pachyrhizi]